MSAVPGTVFVLWWIALGVVALLCVPALLLYLHRTRLAARAIRIYARDTLTAAEGIERNLASAAALRGRMLAEGAAPPPPGGME